MEDKEYIEALEHTLKFICNVYQKNHDKFFEMMVNKENDAYMRLSTVQGSSVRFAIKNISKMPYSDNPNFNINELFEEMKKRSNL